MAFDISRITSAVNKYLNSISDVAGAAKRASEEIAARTQFSTELGEAIQQNIKSRTRDVAAVPDIAAQIKNEIGQATSGFDATIEQINGSFEAIREAGKSVGASSTGSGADAGNNGAGDAGGSAAGVAMASGANASKTNAASGNRDAYAGVLSTEALQELSKSQYFSANLIQSSLFDSLNENGEKESSSNSSGSFNAANILSSSLSSALAGNSSAAANLSAVASAFDTKSLSELNAESLIKAYTNNASAGAATSIFGDFML